MTEVEAIEAELREKHADGIYSEHQLQSWAHWIQMKKHSSYGGSEKTLIIVCVRRLNAQLNNHNEQSKNYAYLQLC